MTVVSNQFSERAVNLLVNYFQAIATKAGMRWDSDYTVEIHEAVDAIVTAAVEAGVSQVVLDERLFNLDERLVEIVRRLDKHERQLRSIELRQ
jgi:hypothetical protein